MKNNYPKSFTSGVLTIFFCLLLNFNVANGQSIYISNNTTLHYNGGLFESGVINNNNGGTFSVSTNYEHSNTNYVNGLVTFLATGGAYNVSLEENATERSPSFASTGIATISYNATKIPTGVAPSDYVLASAEIYTFTGDVFSADATPLSTTSFETATGDVIKVYANDESGPWTDEIIPSITTKMSFARKDVRLKTDIFNLKAFSLYPNPIEKNARNIYFNLPNNTVQLNISLYNTKGKMVQYYDNVPTATRISSVSKPKLMPGVYYLKFSCNSGAKQIVKQIIVE